VSRPLRRKAAAEAALLVAFESDGEPDNAVAAVLHATSLGLAPGGRMRQQIFEDEFDLNDWDQEHGSRCFITIANCADWTAITGEAMPSQPVTVRAYAAAGLPWYDYYAETPALDGSTALQGFKSITEILGRCRPRKARSRDVDRGRPTIQLNSRSVREMQD
jgi:hypothetical protein